MIFVINFLVASIIWNLILRSSILVDSKRELTAPLSPSDFDKESPLLKSRKQIFPIVNRGIGEEALWTLHHSEENHDFGPIANRRNARIHSSLSALATFSEDNNFNQDFSNDRLKVSLDCKSEFMRLHLNFTEPFRGVISVGRSNYPNRTPEERDCSIRGAGSTKYRLDISHLKCLTKFDNKCGQFSNTLFVRYHPTLETGGDYSKTLVCKFGLSTFSVN